MSTTNSRIKEARENAMTKYIDDCVEEYGKAAKACLDQALEYFINNPFSETYQMPVPVPVDESKMFWVALRVLSARRDYEIYVKPYGIGKRQKIKFYSEGSNGNWWYTIEFENLKRDIFREISEDC